jgi:hypothetical protein
MVVFSKYVLRLKILVITCLLFASCSPSKENTLLSPKLDLRFEKSISLDQARAFTKFWRENGFVGTEQQVIKLLKRKVKSKTCIVVCLIPKLEKNTKLSDFSLTSEEITALQPLQQGLRLIVFKSQFVYLAYSDDHFQNPKLILP